MKRLIPWLIVCLMAGCGQQPETDGELQGLREEASSLRAKAAESDRELQSTRERLLITQQALNTLEAEFSTLQASHATLETKSNTLAIENTDLRGQVSLMSEQLRETEAALAEAKPVEIQIVSSADESLSPPPFALYDVSFIGEMDFEGKKRLVGRFSITNNTDQSLRIFANSLFRTIRLEIPARGITNHIHMVAKQGDVLRVNTSNHVETIVW